MGKNLTSKTGYMSICTGKEGAYLLTDNLLLYTPDITNTMSLFISETDTDILVTPQEDATDDLLSCMVAVTAKTAKFVFAKEALLNIVEKTPERIIDLVALVKKHHIESKKLVGLVNTLKAKGKSPDVTLDILLRMSSKDVEKLVSVCDEMPALLVETYTKMITKY